MSEAAHIRYQSKLFKGSSHSWALEQLSELPKNIAVLDIGPGSGVIGKALKESGFTNLNAVEIDEQAREHLKPIYQEISNEISDFSDKQFDVILLLDVIEHMAKPEEFLNLVSKMLTNNGLLLISVPNIAHWSIRLLLLFGFFQYTERGLLDKTHLQFFTRARVKSISKAAPLLRAKQFSASISPAELVLPNWIVNSKAFELFSKTRLLGAKYLPGLCAYQHLCVFSRASK